MTRILIITLLASMTMACSTTRPIQTVDHVDLERFMGDWYVIANIPTFIETEAHNAIETYAMNEDGTVATTFTFRDGSPDGPEKRYEPTGYIVEGTGNAVWGMQFIWPIKAEYLVVYLDDDYQTTIIGRSKRDYVWLMSRKHQLSDTQYQQLVDYIAGLGYDTSLLQKVPQVWPEQSQPEQIRQESHGSNAS
jgi:apolipoprotein D and lipocalin family protein